MVILPAIDIKDGVCVRLSRGEMSTAEKVADNHLDTARAFFEAGAEWLHMVDINGAVEGTRVNSPLFIETAEKSGLKVELGGGLRTMADIDFYLDAGISRVVLGSAALKNPKLVEEAVLKHGNKIAVGIDAKNGLAASEGWTDVSAENYIDLAVRMESLGVETIVFTDIGRDGMLNGPNVEQLAALNSAVACNIVASGGITTVEDIKNLKKHNLYGAICGRSLYTGALDLREAVLAAGEGDA